MPVTNYYTVNGVVIGESTGAETTTYVRDALGSVIESVQGHAVRTYRYKPYGSLLQASGKGEDPRFMWNGSTGSRTTGQAHAEQYNRARHYGSTQASWTTKDPIWPEEPCYVYVGGSPISYSDPGGTQLMGPIIQPPPLPNPVPPPWLPGAPGSLYPPPSGSAGGPSTFGVGELGSGELCVILFGAEAIHEICCYKLNKPSGPFTRCGETIGRWVCNKLYPEPTRGQRDPSCSDAVLASLNAKVRDACKRPDRCATCKGMTMPRDAGRIKKCIHDLQKCIDARRIRAARCWNGEIPDTKNKLRTNSRPSENA